MLYFIIHFQSKINTRLPSQLMHNNSKMLNNHRINIIDVYFGILALVNVGRHTLPQLMQIGSLLLYYAYI